MPTESQTRPQPVIPKRLLKAREAAKYLGLRVDTVYKKSRSRILPSVKIGRALRFDVIALDGFIEEHTIPAQKSKRGS